MSRERLLRLPHGPRWFQQVQPGQVLEQRPIPLLLRGSVRVCVSTTVRAGAHGAVLLQVTRPGVLVRHQPVQEADVAQRTPQDLVLAEFGVGGVCGDETPQLSKGAVHVLLPPAFPTVAGEPLQDQGPAGT